MKTSGARSSRRFSGCAPFSPISNDSGRSLSLRLLVGCLNHLPTAEQVIDRAQAGLFHLIDLRLHSFAIINRELAQHGVCSASLLEDGLFDLLQTFIAILDL